MRIDERDEFVDLVAQAVIDKIEERDRLVGMVNLVVQRVLEFQQEQLKADQDQTEQTQDPNDKPKEKSHAGERKARRARNGAKVPA